MNMTNMPEITMGLVGVSRDCFPVELTKKRLAKVVEECRKLNLNVVPCSTVIESETDAMAAVDEMAEAGVDACAVYLGNFGPEGPTTIFAETLNVPFMLCAAAEESGKDLINGRGDAFCGMLSASLNTKLRDLTPHIPAKPVGLPEHTAQNIAHFIDVARVVVALNSLKVFSFGPRPQDFYACNAPIKPLYDLGLEVMENSELDMFLLYKDAANKASEIDAIVSDMQKELGEGNTRPDKLRQLAQFEVALTGFLEENLGSREYAVYANKCWPAFESAFGFVPCYVNSRLAARGIPAACEVDMYGAVSEYIVQCAGQYPVTILDVNNTVPDDIEIADLKGATRDDLFMGFHCGNTATCLLCGTPCMKYQLIMNRLMEDPNSEPDITAGTLEGTLCPGPTTVFRLQPDLEFEGVMAYLAEGHILDADPASFGSIGIFGIPNFARFYRHTLLERGFPHHAAIGFRHVARIVYDAMALLGVPDLSTPRPPNDLYPTENPF